MTDDTAPEHITPHSIYKMPAEQLDEMLDRLRTRRLSAVSEFEAAQKAAQEDADEKARLALFKQAEMCEKNIIRVDKALEALETRVMKMRALRLELGLD
jgi:hypothetical protein